MYIPKDSMWRKILKTFWFLVWSPRQQKTAFWRSPKARNSRASRGGWRGLVELWEAAEWHPPSAPSLCLSPPVQPFLRSARRAAASISLRPSSLPSSQRGRGGGDGQRGRARRDPPRRAPLPRYVPLFSFPDPSPSSSAQWRLEFSEWFSRHDPSLTWRVYLPDALASDRGRGLWLSAGA